MTKLNDFFGEMLGTAIIVLFGCGSVVVSILFGAGLSLVEVCLIWGVAVTLAIYSARGLSCAHLNPAVSIALVFGGRMKCKKLPVYLLAQFVGAFLAAALLYLVFRDSIVTYEGLHNIVRGSPESVKTAMMFGEFYPNPTAGDAAKVTMFTGFMAEFLGTAILLFFIMILTHDCSVGSPGNEMIPLFIGLGVSINILLFGYLSQAGFNPARDLAPRLFAYMAGWGEAALAGGFVGSMVVYVLGPIAGGIFTALMFRFFIDKMLLGKSK
ncbi:MAG: aquaporin [Bdellovibrio sp.]|nr:aquaporin [Bdellovibrio sp.]